MDAALDHWPSPPPAGWTADDLDRLSEGPDGEPGFFERVELIDGALVFAAPQTRFHQRVLTGLATGLKIQAPGHIAVVTRMDIKLGHRTRPCPDIMAIDVKAADDDDRTFYTPGAVHLAVEVVSPESEDRDRKTKPSRCPSRSPPRRPAPVKGRPRRGGETRSSRRPAASHEPRTPSEPRRAPMRSFPHRRFSYGARP